MFDENPELVREENVRPLTNGLKVQAIKRWSAHGDCCDVLHRRRAYSGEDDVRNRRVINGQRMMTVVTYYTDEGRTAVKTM